MTTRGPVRLLPGILGAVVIALASVAAPAAPPAASSPQVATPGDDTRYRILRVDLPPGPGGPQAGVSRASFLVSCGSREGIQRGSVFSVFRGETQLGTVRVDEVWRDTSVVSLLILSAKPSTGSLFPMERGDHLRPRYVLLDPIPIVGDGPLQVDAEMETRLHTVARLLRDFPDSPVLVEGHTDDAGKAADNLKRSQERASRVRNLLQATYLIAPERMHVRAYGGTEPVVANATAEERRANQRVDLIVVDQVPPEPPPPPPPHPHRRTSRKH